jgi:hypothetical protein
MNAKEQTEAIRSQILAAKPNLRVACKSGATLINHPLEIRALGRAIAVLEQKPEKLTRGSHTGYVDSNGNQRYTISKLLDLVEGSRYLWGWKDRLTIGGSLPPEWQAGEQMVYGVLVVRESGEIEVSREFSEEKHRKFWNVQSTLVDPALFKSPVIRVTKDVLVCRVLAGEKFDFDRKNEVHMQIVTTFYRDELRTIAGLSYRTEDTNA